jgi:hypothetical protein
MEGTVLLVRRRRAMIEQRIHRRAGLSRATGTGFAK